MITYKLISIEKFRNVDLLQQCDRVMSVICESERGWVVDHAAAINATYCQARDVSRTGRMTPDGSGSDTNGAFHCRPELFEIWKPYMMDSQYAKLNDAVYSQKPVTIKQKVIINTCQD